MKNPVDLQEALYSQLERLGEKDVKGEKLKEEIARTDAISKIASQIINNGRLVVDAYKMAASEDANIELPDMFKVDNGPTIKKLSTNGKRVLIASRADK